MIKLEIVTGSLQISNGGSVILVAPKNSCAIDVLALYDVIPFIIIYNKYLGNATVIFNQPLANCEDSTGTPFDVTSFITFAEANLGFDTSGGGGNYIPLTGTDSGSPVSGNIEFDFNANLGIYATDGNIVSKFDLNDKPSIIYSDPTDSSDTYLNNSSFNVSSSNSTFKGFSGGQDFSANITNLDYAQKVYVDTKQPQLSGSGFVIASGTTISYDDNIYVESIVNEFPNSSVTGTLSETLLSTFTILGGTLSEDCMPDIRAKFSKVGDSSGATIRLKMNTVNNFATSTQIATFAIVTTTDTALMSRNPVISSGNMNIIIATTSIQSDLSGVATTESNFTINVANDIYLFVSVALSTSINDTVTLRAFKIIN
jgi:hypothetical protein